MPITRAYPLGRWLKVILALYTKSVLGDAPLSKTPQYQPDPIILRYEMRIKLCRKYNPASSSAHILSFLPTG